MSEVRGVDPAVEHRLDEHDAEFDFQRGAALFVEQKECVETSTKDEAKDEANLFSFNMSVRLGTKLPFKLEVMSNIYGKKKFNHGTFLSRAWSRAL